MGSECGTQAGRSSTLLTDQPPHLKQTCFRGPCSSGFLDKITSWALLSAGDFWGKNFFQSLQKPSFSGILAWNQVPDTESEDKGFSRTNLFPRLIHSFILEESSLLRAFICKTKGRMKMSPCTQKADLPFPRAFAEAQLQNDTFSTASITNSPNILKWLFNPSVLKNRIPPIPRTHRALPLGSSVFLCY